MLSTNFYLWVCYPCYAPLWTILVEEGKKKRTWRTCISVCFFRIVTWHGFGQEQILGCNMTWHCWKVFNYHCVLSVSSFFCFFSLSFFWLFLFFSFFFWREGGGDLEDRLIIILSGSAAVGVKFVTKCLATGTTSAL